MIAGVADTHILIWYLTGSPRLSATAQRFISAAAQRGESIGLAAITFVELVYLIEKGRIPAETLSRTAHILEVQTFVEIPLTLAISRTLSKVDVVKIPDMPDRIIAATALHLNLPLISRDGRIRLAGLQTIW